MSVEVQTTPGTQLRDADDMSTAGSARSSTVSAKMCVEEIFEDESRIQERLWSHRVTMYLLGLLHLGLLAIAITFLLVLPSPRQLSHVCVSMRNAPLLIYSLANLMLGFFCLRSQHRANIEAADLLVFDLQANLIFYLMLAPFLMAASFAASEVFCHGSKLGIQTTLVLSLHLFLELFLIRTYVKWHKNNLRKFEGAID